MHFLIITKFETVVRGAQDHPTCNKISSFDPESTNFLFLASKHLISFKAVCNKVSNTFDSTICWLAVRLSRWLLNWHSVIQRQ